MTAIRNSQTKSTTHQRHHFDGAFCVMFRVQTWCKFGAKTYRTMRKICNDMRRKRHKIARNKRFSTIFRGINASRKTPRDNWCPFGRNSNSTHICGCCFLSLRVILSLSNFSVGDPVCTLFDAASQFDFASLRSG